MEEGVPDEAATCRVAACDRFEKVVQDATGRPVIGFMSGNQQDPDMICEVFVLAHNDVMH